MTAEDRIRFWIKAKPGRCAVACSFGRDSMTVLHMALQHDPNIPVVFNNTLCEHPETIQFKRRITAEWHLNLIETRPDTTFWKIIEAHGLPATSRTHAGVPRCCYHLKEKPAVTAYRDHGLTVIFTGLRKDESRNRFLSLCHWGQEHLNTKYGYPHWRIHPLADWTLDDVMTYHTHHAIPLNPIYNKLPRCGCAFCPAHLNWEPQVATLYPAAYRKLQSIHGQDLLEYK